MILEYSLLVFVIYLVLVILYYTFICMVLIYKNNKKYKQPKNIKQNIKKVEYGY